MTESITDLISIRPIKIEDLHFILDSSISCLTKYTESIVKGYSYEYAHKLLEKIILKGLNDPNNSIFIACLREDENHILAYIVANPKTNHIFLQYTKYNWRPFDIQKLFLLPLVLDFNSKITVNWPTKEMLKLQKQGILQIENRFIEDLL